jgi:hypothetical protein
MKSFPPQIPMDDMEIIYAIFTGSVIIEGDGKQPAIHAFLFPPLFRQLAWGS